MTQKQYMDIKKPSKPIAQQIHELVGCYLPKDYPNRAALERRLVMLVEENK